jgi:uncharacterized spore protein YtfJ
MIVEHEERRTNPYSILELDEEEEPEDEEMEDKVDEMQVASPQRSPRRPAEKRMEREDGSVGSMRRPSTRGKHEMVETKEKKDGASEEAKKDDFMYASKPKEEGMNPDDQLKDDIELTNEVEEDDLFFLEGDYGDGEDGKRAVEEKEDQLMVSEEAEWGDTRLEKDAQEIKEVQKKERKEKVEGVDSAAGKEKEAKLGEQEDERSSKLAKQTIEETNKVLMSNPYVNQVGILEEVEWDDTEPEKEAKEIKVKPSKEREVELEGGTDSTVDSKRRSKLAMQKDDDDDKLGEQRNVKAGKASRKNPYAKSAQQKGEEEGKASGKDDEKATPIKSNKTKVKGGKAKEQMPVGDKLEDGSGDESVATIPQSNIKPNPIQTSPRRDLRQAVEGVALPIFRGTLPRKYLYRYDLKLQVPASEDPVAALIQAAKAFWAQMLETDKTVALAPWAQEHQQDNPLLLSLAKFPTTLSVLKKYFSRAQPNTKGQTLYVSILMAHNTPYEEIMENIRWWLGEKKFGLWKRQVQSETVKPVGYLLYSTRALEPEYMKELVERAVNQHKKARKFGQNLELGFRWRVIPMGKQGRIKEEDQVRALHIECPAEQFQVAKAILAEIYSADAESFPGGIKLRLVPDIYGVANPETRAKVLHLRARQATFLKKIMVMTSYEIASLDYRFVDDEGYEGSMRERLMWIASQERDYLSQFVSVTSQYNGTGVVFTFIPQLESEARSLVASLIPLFRYEYGEDIKKFFKPDAWEMHEDTYWDPDLRVAVTPDDKRVDDIAEQDPEYQWLEEGAAVELINVPKRPDPKEKSLYGDDGGDSVSTFRTGVASIKERLEEAAQQKTPKAGAGTGQVVTPVASTQQEDTSSITSTLDGTVESRISSLESVTEQTSRMIQDMMKMMQKFTKAEENKGQRQSNEVATTVDQYESKQPSRGEEKE